MSQKSQAPPPKTTHLFAVRVFHCRYASTETRCKCISIGSKDAQEFTHGQTEPFDNRNLLINMGT